MNELLIGLLGAVLSTNPVTSASNVIARTTGLRLPVVDPNDPVEQEYQNLLAADDAAQEEVDRWIRDSNAFAAQGAELSSATLSGRIDQRFEPILKGYEDLILRHPKHVRARLAYGSFLNDIGREADARVQWERALKLDPKNPAAWNNLANLYSHAGPIKKAFEYYAKAMELEPTEPVYVQNLATVVFLFRKDAKEYYQLADDQKVLRRALELYRKATKLAPDDFSLATHLAQTYYYLKAEPASDPAAAKEAEKKLYEEAVAAWLEAQKLAREDSERQGVAIHLARISLNCGRTTEARRYLETVNHPTLQVLKERNVGRLERMEKGQAEPDEKAD